MFWRQCETGAFSSARELLVLTVSEGYQSEELFGDYALVSSMEMAKSSGVCDVIIHLKVD